MTGSERSIRQAYMRGRLLGAVEAARRIVGPGDASHLEQHRKAVQRTVRSRVSNRIKVARPSGNEEIRVFGAILRDRIVQYGNTRKRSEHQQEPADLRAALLKSRGLPGQKGSVERVASPMVVHMARTTTLAKVQKQISTALGFSDVAEMAEAGVVVDTLFQNEATDQSFRVLFASGLSGSTISHLNVSKYLEDRLPAARVFAGSAEKVRRHVRTTVNVGRIADEGRDEGGRTKSHSCCCGCCGDEVDQVGGTEPPVDRSTRPTWRSTPADTEWHLKQMRVLDAWSLTPPSGGKKHGSGIIVAHPDTGWREHPEYDQSNIDFTDAANVMDGSSGKAATRHGTMVLPPIYQAHGTGTGATIVSARATGETFVQDIPTIQGTPTNSIVELTGVAPSAKVVPIRTTDSVALILDTNIHKAIEHAIAVKAHVVSISLGGTVGFSLENLIDEAVEKHDIIIVAATGQYVDFLSPSNSVVEPASFPNVIAAAGSTPSGGPWEPAGHGANVDIAAPAKDVWFAGFDWDGTPRICLGEGTSFSAAEVAGAAALWLAFHGRKALLEKYKPSGVPLAHVFRHLVRKTCWRPSHWDSAWGPGIVDAYALLAEPLPVPGDVIPPRKPQGSLFDGFSDLATRMGELGAWGWKEATKGAGEVGRFLEETLKLQEIGETLAELQNMAQGASAEAKAWIDEQVALGEQALEEGADSVVETMEGLATLGAEAAEGVGDLVESAGELADEGGNSAKKAVDDTVDFIVGLFS